ncbi:MAG TPA: AMED_5909 family protein [Glaciihabitans sp.]|nr:AMED_5909 family protein [Glaciihabitans sp.]
MTKPSKAKPVAVPQTLGQAHSDVLKRRPPPESTLVVQRKFHQDNKRLYEGLADIDRAHHHEILYWVEYERRKVETLTELIRSGQTKAIPQ